MSTTDFRCKRCRSLLARRDGQGLSILRGTLQVTVTSLDATVSVTCYRCATLNVERLAPTPALVP